MVQQMIEIQTPREFHYHLITITKSTKSMKVVVLLIQQVSVILIQSVDFLV